MGAGKCFSQVKAPVRCKDAPWRTRGISPLGCSAHKEGGRTSPLLPLSSGCPISPDAGGCEGQGTLPRLLAPISFLCIPCGSSTPAAATSRPGARLLPGTNSKPGSPSLRLLLVGLPGPPLPGWAWVQRAGPNPGHGRGHGGGIGGAVGFPKSSLPCSRHPPLLLCQLAAPGVCISRFKQRRRGRFRHRTILGQQALAKSFCFVLVWFFCG